MYMYYIYINCLRSRKCGLRSGSVMKIFSKRRKANIQISDKSRSIVYYPFTRTKDVCLLSANNDVRRGTSIMRDHLERGTRIYRKGPVASFPPFRVPSGKRCRKTFRGLGFVAKCNVTKGKKRPRDLCSETTEEPSKTPRVSCGSSATQDLSL